MQKGPAVTALEAIGFSIGATIGHYMHLMQQTRIIKNGCHISGSGFNIYFF